MSSRSSVAAVSFVAGIALSSLVSVVLQKRRKENRKYAGATVERDDLSLFYGDVDKLNTVSEGKKFLPADLYGRMVRDCVVCCVDCLLVRYNPTLGRKECLLVERGSEPVKGVWWLPGGRMFKGETFFDAAKRKAREETGLSYVKPIQVLGIWNTFFPTSNWDTEEEKGTQTVNPIVMVEIENLGANVSLDSTSEKYRWIGLDPEEAKANGEDKYVYGALFRLQAWDPSYVSK